MTARRAGLDTWRDLNSNPHDANAELILNCVCLNHTLNDASLCLQMRSPFDYLAKRAFLKDGRGNWRSFEPCPQILTPFVGMFLGPPEPHFLTAGRLVRHVVSA